jgi:hypothetical protein
MTRPHRYRLRATVWFSRRVISMLDLISDWEIRRRYPQ